ncbi:hypothetical protein BST24_12540 [Mycobacteroides franklinii]|nr:hypothetical protein BST24_12540 [Mycobacteroides franklinii]
MQWAIKGDRTPEGAHSLRIAGEHYTARPGINTGPSSLGFDGAVRRWRDSTGAEYFSNDVMCQGAIPSALQDMLPDNAEWVDAPVGVVVRAHAAQVNS